MVNGVNDAITETASHTFTTKTGKVFELCPISAVMLRRIGLDSWGKPQPPVVETAIGPQKRKKKEANPDDPEYKAALATWQDAHNERVLIYIFTRGVVDVPSEEEKAQILTLLPGQNEMEVKYSWILDQLGDDESVAMLSAAIIGINMPTETGISEAESRFPGDSQSE